MRNTIAILFLTCFFSGCLFSDSERTLFQKTLSDGSIIRGVGFVTVPASDDIIWVIRKPKGGSCYITGKLEIGFADNKFEITELSEENVNIRVEDTVNLKGMYIDFVVSKNDTFCFNQDCIKYPVRCE